MRNQETVERLKAEQRQEIMRIVADLETDPTNLARAAGVAPSTVNRFLKDGGASVRHALSAATMAAIRAVWEQKRNFSLDTAQMGNVSLTNRSDSRFSKREITPLGFIPTTDRERTVPVRGTARNGIMGLQFFEVSEPADHVERPALLDGNQQGYAFRVEGDAMAPALRRGFVAYCDPTITPRPDDLVVVYDCGGMAFVREYVAESAETYTLRAYAPAGDVEYSKADISRVHVIVQTERRPG